MLAARPDIWLQWGPTMGCEPRDRTEKESKIEKIAWICHFPNWFRRSLRAPIWERERTARFIELGNEHAGASTLRCCRSGRSTPLGLYFCRGDESSSRRALGVRRKGATEEFDEARDVSRGGIPVSTSMIVIALTISDRLTFLSRSVSDRRGDHGKCSRA
jgi:hypothetical protein